MTSFTVELRDLRQALTAVMPHVPSVKDDVLLARVRLTPFAHTLELTATDRHTMALALVSVQEYTDDSADVIELSAIDVTKILAVFKNPAPGEEALVRIATTTEELVLTDVSGLVDGEALILQRLTQEEKFPKIRELFSGLLQGNRSITGDFWLNAPLLKRFDLAQRAYGHPLIFEPYRSNSKALIVRCGDSFLGLIARRRPDDGDLAQASRWVQDWNNRLPLANADIEVVFSDLDKERATWDARPTPPEAAVADLSSHGDEVIQAAELVITTQFASSAMLQRKMRIGAARARRVLDELHAAGVVGEADGSKPREVLTPAKDIESAMHRIRTVIESVST